jgi:DNA repair protein RecN (Recombination protein N)
MQPSGALSMITGETGAGKSIMLGAVGLLLGNRVDTKVLLHEDQKCVVEGVFEIGQYGLKDFFELEGLDFESTCIIRREIIPGGKSRSFVNDTPVLLDTLKNLGGYLMDVHSQHDTLKLGEGSYQLGLIDAFAQTQNLLKSYRAEFRIFKSNQKAFFEIRNQAQELKKEADFNQFQLDELQSLNLQPDEQSDLETNQELLQNAEEIKLKINEILGLFQDEQFGVIQGLAQIQHGMLSLEKLAQKFQNFRERSQSALIEAKDLVDSLIEEDSGIEVDFEKLQLIRERLSKIYQLQKKHGVNSVQELIQLQEELANKVFQFQNLDEILQKAKDSLEESERKVMDLGQKLRAQRMLFFEDFQRSLEKLLVGLGMENAKLVVEHQAIEPSYEGLDEIELLFSANKGSAPQPMKKVASGGEFSRLLFAIKYLMADKMALPTLIFDEIDAGISGEIALQMVKMMKVISRNHQVICITHLPQVAGQGDLHYYVYKDNTSDKTVSKVKLLEGEDRVLELAKMISGSLPSASALESARELLRR